MMKFIGIIPARYASTRFPGKPLALLGGKPIIQHVYEQVKRCIDDVWVATDDQRIIDVVSAFGGKAIMTSDSHKSGTDRIHEAADLVKTDADVIINIQGDEPFIAKEQIETICQCFDDSRTQIATLAKPFEKDINLIRNVNSPKVVTDLHGYALYFSRSIIPFVRGFEQNEWSDHHTYLKHIGIYAYRKEVLDEITQLSQSPLELVESLEQLRWLQNGYKIKVGLTNIETIGIDTPEDLKKAEDFLKRTNHKGKDGE